VRTWSVGRRSLIGGLIRVHVLVIMAAILYQMKHIIGDNSRASRPTIPESLLRNDRWYRHMFEFIGATTA
jgi:hypothetical protein